MMNYSLLPDRAALAVSGEDARDFLQGLITKDVRKIKPGEAVFAALLSPQGRFLFDFFITEHEGRLWLETDKAHLPDLLKRLTMYRLRSKVEFEELPEIKVAAIWGDLTGLGAYHGNKVIYRDPRLTELGLRMVKWDESADSHIADYDLHRLSLGVPEGAKDLIADRSLILEYGYDELHGVDFDKGCYVGQEVTARSKHRATLRKFIHSVQSQQPLPPKGTPVMNGTREAGTMASSSGTVGLAHLKVEEVERAAREETELSAGGVALAATLPPWCRTQFQTGPA